jgi:hypothetical protein
LSEAQRQRVEGLFAAMKAEAVPLGERLIAKRLNSIANSAIDRSRRRA